jgi:hypothetical protein
LHDSPKLSSLLAGRATTGQFVEVALSALNERLELPPGL